MWAFLETFKIDLKMGLSNMENQRKMGFLRSSRGVITNFGKILVLVDFWYLVVVLSLIISTGPSVSSFLVRHIFVLLLNRRLSWLPVPA